jgi:hypothetical protein
VTGALVPLGLSANEQLQTTLERCGISIGVDEPDDGNPPLSESDCEEFFSWYQTTADLLADYDALSIEAGVPSLEFGLILLGGYGSPDLTTESGGDEATPTQDTSPVASPATSPTPSPVGSPSPAATPHYTAQECADWREYNNRQFETTDDFLVAAIELRQLYSSTGEPPSADTVSPEAAREWADTLDASIREYTSIDVPAVAQDQHDAGLAARTAISDALRDFADAVEGGADRNQAIVQFLYNNPAVAEPGTRQRTIIDQFQASCYQGAGEDAETFHEYARLTENAIEAQSSARTPRVAREVNDAFVEALEAYDSAFLEYADRIEAGEDREMLTAELGAKILEPSIAATEAMRDLLERCGIAIGITEPDDGQPPLSNGQCKQVFRWYKETADRMTDLVAADFPFLESGLVLPGSLGSIDLDNLS